MVLALPIKGTCSSDRAVGVKEVWDHVVCFYVILRTVKV